MIEKLFMQVLSMSLTGSIVILAVFLMRLFLNRSPKIFSYCLWAAVLFRLLCPVSYTAFFSPFSMFQVSADFIGKREYIPEEMITHVLPDDLAAVPKGSEEADSTQSYTKLITSKSMRPNRTVKTASVIWLLGICVLIILNLIKIWKLNRSLKNASWEKENIYKMEGLATPFVIGIFSPKIYLPYDLDTNERKYVLLHEQIHLKRKDHVIKLVSYMALCLHWFNPLVWTAFFLSSRDMEMSCDEAVLRRMGKDVKKDYSSSLLSMAAGRSAIKGVPLAFGEGDPGSRIKNVLRYQKPAAFVTLGAAVLCTVTIVVLLADPDISAKNENHSMDSDSAENGLNVSSAAKEDVPKEPDQSFYEISIRTISRNTRTIDTYVQPEDFPFDEGEPLVFSDDCRFEINVSMDGLDYKEVSFEHFVSYAEKGGNYLNKPCLLSFEDGQIVYAALKSAWFHYGIIPLQGVSECSLYDSLIESDGEEGFYKNYSLVSSETMDIADCEGSEKIEVYREKNGDAGIVLFKNTDGRVLSTQDVDISRSGWNNIYLGSAGKTSFILILHIEDRWTYVGYNYEVYRLDEEGSPLMIASSEFEYNLSRDSSIIYDDDVFRTWADSMESYLKDSHLILSSQDAEIRTEKVSEADKYNYDTLSLQERAAQFSADDDGMICFQGSWYGRDSLQKETAEWIAWYNRLPEEDQLKISSIPPELIDAKYMVNDGVQDADAE